MAQSTTRALRRQLVSSGSDECLSFRLPSIRNRQLVKQIQVNSQYFANRSSSLCRSFHSIASSNQSEAGPSRLIEERDVRYQSQYSDHIPSSSSKYVSNITLMRREMEHPDYRPIVLAELLAKAIDEQDFTASPLKQLQPREISRALKLLRDRVSKEGNWQQLSLLQYIDDIANGLHRCYDQIRLVTERQLRSQTHGIRMAEREVHDRIANDHAVKKWKILTTSKFLNELLSSCWKISSRRPTIGDIQDKISQMVKQPQNLCAASFETQLAEIVRSLPPYRSIMKTRNGSEWLKNAEEDRLRISWDRINKSQEEIGTVSEILQNSKATASRVEPPLSFIILFEEIWQVIRAHSELTASCFSCAIKMEIRLASWRSAKLGPSTFSRSGMFDGENDEDLGIVWKPVTDLIEDLHNQNLLESRLINDVLFETLRCDPNYSSDDTEGDYVWPSLDYLSEVYQIMRHTLLKKEEGRVKGNENDSSLVPNPIQGPLTRFLGNITLPKNIMPTEWTYNLMIRYYSSRGNLTASMQIVKDMKETATSVHEDGDLSPSMITFGQIFRYFAKFGIPSKLIAFDAIKPEQSLWTKNENIDGNILLGESGAWTIDNFQELYEMFLRMTPTTPGDISQSKKNIALPRMDQLDKEFQDKQWLVDDSLNPSAFENIEKPIGQSPSPQHLFFILTALRRVSGDEAKWVLAQFVRLAAKFSVSPSLVQNSARDANNNAINQQGWVRFRFDERVKRVLKLLYDLRDSQDVELDYENDDDHWKTKFMVEVAREMADREQKSDKVDNVSQLYTR